MLKLFATAFILLLGHCCSAKVDTNSTSLGWIIKMLELKVNSYQVLHETPYLPPVSWYTRKGLYRSEVRFNAFGKPLFQSIRTARFSGIFDNDMFSTGWIVVALLEAKQYGRGVSALSSERLELALDAISAFRDRNQPVSNETLIRTFWPQIFNDTSQSWYQQPANIHGLLESLGKSFDTLEQLLKLLG